MVDNRGPGRKFRIAVMWGAALIGVLLIFLAFGVRSDVLLAAWLAAFVAIPVQFSIGNVAVNRAYAEVEVEKARAPIPGRK